MHATATIRLRMLALISMLMLGTTMAQAQIQMNQPGEAIIQRALDDFFGESLDAKNGPLAKAGWHLAILYHEHKDHQENGFGAFRSTNDLLHIAQDRVVIDAFAAPGMTAAKLRADLEALGLQNAATWGRMVSGRIPIDAIPQMAALPSLQVARASMAMTHGEIARRNRAGIVSLMPFARPEATAPARSRIGSVTSQGDAAMEADAVRMAEGVDGTGQRIGTLSDSFDCLGGAAAGIASGDLPGVGNPLGNTTPVTVVTELSPCTGTDEGRGMIELIHDVAPGATLSFHTAFGGEAAFASGISALVADGATIIVDDVITFGEAFYQDDAVAQAADAAFASGVAYFSSAGNQDDQSWEDSFRGTGIPGPPGLGGGFDCDSHDFDPGGGPPDIFQSFSFSGSVIVVFQWENPHASAGGAAATDDLDICVTNTAGTTTFLCSAAVNVGGDPVEVMSFSGSGTFAFYIGRFSPAVCPPPPDIMIKYVWFGSVTPLEFFVPSPTLFGHANADGAFATAAMDYFETPAFSGGLAPEPFTAVGGVPIKFTTAGIPTGPITRMKPDATGPDGANTTFFGSDRPDPGDGSDTDTDPNFFGTSAAAPHVAALAALGLEFLPSTPTDLYAALTGSATDIPPSAAPKTFIFDAVTGFGLVNGVALVGLLPVELTSFDALADGDAVILHWETASETNNAGFEIQHRYFDSGFESVGFVEGHGTTLDGQRYTYRLENLEPGQHTFRLKQIDFDGTFEHHPEVEVFVELAGTYALSGAYPNPFNPETQVTLMVAVAQQIRVEVYDVVGRRVALLHDGLLEADELHRFVFDARALPSGLYVYRVIGERFNDFKSMMLVK